MPLIYEYRSTNGGIVGIWAITETADQLVSGLILTEEDFQKQKTFMLESRRAEWLAVRKLVWELSNLAPIITYHPSGKPFLPHSNIHISISHTKGFAAVAMHPSQVAAIDIEHISDRVLKISDRFLHPSEAEYIPETEKSIYQTIIWSAKETLFKWWGKDAIIFKEQLRILPFIAKMGKFEINANLLIDNNIETALTLSVRCNPNYLVVYVV